MHVCTRCHQNLAARAEWCPDCGAEVPVRGWPDDPLVGASVLGRYRIERRIGAGGMGVVYRAVDRSGDAFALKALRGALEDDEAMRRFRREARTAALLQSSAAARVFESGVLEDGTPYFVMELVDGRPLTAALREDGPLSVVDALRLLDDLCDVLIEAHGLGLVHRDLKPDNLLMVRGPRLKVLDFGIVKVLDPAVGTVGGTVTGKVFGTPEFMSPEQVRGLPDVDARSDVFSAGLCAFVMLTGRLPFTGRTPQEVMLTRLHTRAPRLSAVRPAVPAALDTIIDRMLEPAADDRPASMAEVRAALRAAAPASVSASDTQPTRDTQPAVPPAVAAADTVPADSASATTPAPRPTGPLPRLLGAGAAFLLVMVALAWLFAR